MQQQHPPVVVREVWESNLVSEFNLIQLSLPHYPLVSLDTEFPGTVYHHPTAANQAHLSPSEFYAVMKKNVDALNIIQLGLTLSDANGNLPNFGSASGYVWEFNFKDFDAESDLQNPESITLLKGQGLDFVKNRQFGIDSQHFGHMFRASGMCLNAFKPGIYRRNLTWITFHGAYDFAFLFKIVTRRELPEDVDQFMRLVGVVFGCAVYDLKPMIRAVGLHGGLERVARTLKVDRAVGKSHQAGSDSLLTMHAFLELRNTYFCGEGGMSVVMNRFNHKLYGLTAVY